MHADAGGEPHVDAGRLIVEVAPTGGDEGDREVAHLALRRAPRRHSLGTAAPIDVETVRAVDEDVRHGGVAHMLGERTQGRIHVDDGVLGVRGGLSGSEDERFGHATTLGGRRRPARPDSHVMCTTASWPALCRWTGPADDCAAERPQTDGRHLTGGMRCRPRAARR